MALGIRIVFIVVVAPQVPTLGDASAYHLLAEQPRARRRVHPAVRRPAAPPAAPDRRVPAAVPALLSLPARLGAHSVEQQRIFVAFVGAATVVLVGLLGRRVASRAVGLIAAALAAVYPMLFLSEATLMAESLYVALVTLVLLGAYRAYDDPKPARFVALGAAIGLATLTRAEGILLGIVVVDPARPCCCAVSRTRARAGAGRDRARHRGRRDRAVDDPQRGAVPHVRAGVEQRRHARRRRELRRDLRRRRRSACGARRSRSSATRPRTLPQAQACFEGFDIADPHFDEAHGREHATRAPGATTPAHHLGSLPKVAVVRVLRTWGLYAPRQQVDFESLEGRPRAWQMRGTIMYWVLLPLAVAGAVVLRRRRRLLVAARSRPR